MGGLLWLGAPIRRALYGATLSVPGAPHGAEVVIRGVDEPRQVVAQATDGAPIRLDAGQYAVEVRAWGYWTARTRISVAW